MAAPAAVILPLFVWFFWRVKLPFWDQFTMSLLFDKFYSSQLSLHDLWESYNGHRIFFPRIISLALGIATRWQVVLEAVISNLLNVAIFLVIVREIRASLGIVERTISPALLLFLSVSCFSMNQYENWFNGWDICMLLAELCSIGALLLLSREVVSLGAIFGAAALAMISSFSFGAALAIWPVGCVALLLNPGKRNLPALIIWIAVAALTAFLFASGSAAQSPFSLADILHFPLYFASFLGGPVFSINGAKASYLGPALQFVLSLVAPLIGVLGLTGILLLYLQTRRMRLPRTVTNFPLLLCLFALFAGGLIAFGRTSFGRTQAMSPHYITISRLLWIGGAAFYCAVRPALGQSIPRLWARITVAAMALMMAASYANGVRQLLDWHRVQLECQDQLWTTYDDITLRNICPILSFPELHQCVEALKRNHLALYRGMQIESKTGVYLPGNAVPHKFTSATPRH